MGGGGGKGREEGTVEPRYKEVGYNKTLLYKVILLVPAFYTSLFFTLI